MAKRCVEKEITMNNYMNYEYDKEMGCYTEEAPPIFFGGGGDVPTAETPQTGDLFDMWFWLAVLLGAVLVFIGMKIEDKIRG